MKKIYTILRKEPAKVVGAYTSRELAVAMLEMFKRDEYLKEYEYTIDEVKIWL